MVVVLRSRVRTDKNRRNKQETTRRIHRAGTLSASLQQRQPTGPPKEERIS
jgi:hypothetical protein